jgi:error-prone DNA polymerase
MDELRFVYPEKHLPSGETPITYFRQIVAQGVTERYGANPSAQIKQQLAHELELIETLNVEGFFLTMYDIIRFARSQGILCQGRGSAANSAICYALGITSVEPVSAGLLFERFLSLERGEPPDIDVDFEHERREEVIQWVYDFYGRDHAGLVCTNICYRPRSAVRDVGKAVGLTLDQTDRLAKGLSQWTKDAPLDTGLLLDSGIDPDSNIAAQLREFIPQILGFPRHRGTHVGGMVVTAEPLIDIVPLENAAMENRAIIPWDKDDADILGMCKFDLLGLGILTALQKTMTLIEVHEGRRYNLAAIPQADALTYERISASDTIGTFQIESRAQQSMLPRLRPQCFYDLVIAISIIRPGPIQGGMVHPFLRRRNGEEPITFPHPSLVPILARTLGVPLFQEQVMRMAVEVAGFSPGEADELRRKMGAWRRRGTMQDVRERLVTGMKNRGIPKRYAEQIFKQIQGFGEYGFPESHAISFALLAYASAWLKTHYPAHYVTGLLNSQPLGFYAPHTLIEDAKRHGVVFLPVDVEHSDWHCTLENRAVRLGVRYISGLGPSAQASYEGACHSRPFKTVDSFATRTGFDHQKLSRLAHAGAFRSLNRQIDATSPQIIQLCRRAAFWEVLHPRQSSTNGQIPLPDAPRAAFPRMSRREEVHADFEVTGLSADAHPVSFLREALAAQGIIAIADLARLRDGIPTRVGGLIIGRQHPQTAKGFVFLSLEDETGILNIIVSPQLFERQHTEITKYPLVSIGGTLQSATGSLSLKATNVVPIQTLKQQPDIRARDFR